MARIQIPKKGTITCDSNTAEEAVEYLRQVLDEPWHGNVLLSCGPHKLEPKQQLQEFNSDFVFANYSSLSSGPPINIAATELRGITIEQLSSLLVFVEDIASSWCEAHHLGYGQPLSFEAFNLYHANFWVIEPATAGHGRGGCSYVELVAASAQMQCPLWFVSHAWLEPVCKFVACLKCHASLRQLPDQTAYWVCAYANNQHQLENEICNNPRKTSFYRAIQLCAGVLLVLDENATPFTRIWCCFEESIAVEERNKGNPLLLDVAATENGRAHVITDGLVGAEQEMMPLLGFLAKSKREAEFPTEILMKGLDVNIASAMASEASDKTKILNSIRLPRAGTVLLEQRAPAAHESYDAVGRALAGHFALANWFSSVAKGLDTSRLLTALQNDEKRRVVQLSLTGCCKFDDSQLCTFLEHLPPQLQVLRLDLGFTAVECVELDAPLPELQELSLRIIKTPLRQVKLQRSMMPKLRSLHLWLSSLPALEELQLHMRGKCDGLRELVLHVHRCPKLAKVAKQGIYNSVHGWPWRHTDKWISIEEVEPAWFQMFGGKNLPEDAIPRAKFDAAKFQETSSDLPFPCSETKCGTFHPNRHGFCHKHRFHRFGRKLSAALVRALGWLELVLLLTIQAAAEIQSRILLLLILLSLLPVTCIFLEQNTGMSAASICITFLAVAVGTCLYTAKRLDGMQQRSFNMALATEASYFQVLQPTSETSDNLVQVSTILRNHSDGLSQEVPQTEQDLESNYQLAKRHMNLFQTVVCEPLASTGLEFAAKIKSLTELDEREGGADILFCEVWCDSLQEVQDAWDMLKDLDGVEILSARDFFAVASSKKCLQVVVSVQSYLATVVLMEKSLSAWEAQKGLSDAADSLGLLDKTKASAWEVSRLQHDSQVPRGVFVATALLRLVALFSCYIIGAKIGGPDSYSLDPFFGLFNGLHHCTILYDKYDYYYGEEYCLSLRGLRMLPMTLPFLTCFLILLWEMLSCCCCCLCCCKRRRSFKIRPRPTQLWYRKYLGVQGCHYAFKVAALQFLTVVMQGLAKASLFRTIQATHGSEALRASTAAHCFMVLLLCNILFPAMILVIPNYVFTRVGAALLDAVLDVGYMVTSIWLYVVFATESVTDIFLNSFLNYMSIYICIAHVLCVCRSLETADWIALFQVPRAAPACKAWKRMILSSSYGIALLASVGIPVGGMVLGAFSDSSHADAGLCPLCECSAVAPASLLLERCVIPTGYVAQGVPDMLEFNLANLNITEVLPDAFIARGAHQRVRSVSLRGNHLTELPEGLFRDLLQQRDIDTLDLADNRIVSLSRGVFQAGGICDVRILDMSRNQLQELDADTFHGLKLDTLDMSQNQLQVLHADTFHGLTFSSYGILDMSQNKLQELPPKVFHNLKLDRLYLQNNNLIQLHADTFHGLTFDWNGMLDLAWNELATLSSGGVFYGLRSLHRLRLEGNRLRSLGSRPFHHLYDLRELSLERNRLTDLDEDVFESHSSYYYSLKRNLLELNLGGNRLTTLPGGIFKGFRKLQNLQLQSNVLVRLSQQLFQNLSSLKLLNLSQNALDDLPPDLFDGLNLEVIDLSRNKLRTLNATLFDLESLTTLDLRGNRLTDATLQDLARLKVELHVD